MQFYRLWLLLFGDYLFLFNGRLENIQRNKHTWSNIDMSDLSTGRIIHIDHITWMLFYATHWRMTPGLGWQICLYLHCALKIAPVARPQATTETKTKKKQTYIRCSSRGGMRQDENCNSYGHESDPYIRSGLFRIYFDDGGSAISKWHKVVPYMWPWHAHIMIKWIISQIASRRRPIPPGHWLPFTD